MNNSEPMIKFSNTAHVQFDKANQFQKIGSILFILFLISLGACVGFPMQNSFNIAEALGLIIIIIKWSESRCLRLALETVHEES